MKLVSTLIFLCFAAFLLSSSPTFPILASAQDPVCGKDAGGAYCPNNECCSNSGQCGTTVEYCGPDDCQLNCRQCGDQTGGALSCNEGYCCSNEGFCGTTDAYCVYPDTCQSQCWDNTPPPPPTLTAIAQTNGDISTIITRSVFEEMLKHRNDFRCQSKGFYSYKAFITAARSFQGFATTGSIVTRKKELAAFFAQTSALTKGGWPGAPDGLHAWGYCYIKAKGSQAKYYGRGPMQLAHKSMYGLAGQALGIDLIENPNLVATDPVVSFKTAIWFWMTPQKDQPSCHDVITNKWEPSDSDLAAGRVPGYGLITNIINGEDACGRSPNANAADRVQFYKRYCDLLNVNYGDNLDCYHQRPFPKIAMVNDM